METIYDFLEINTHSKANDEAFTYIEDNGEKSQIRFNDLHQRAQSIAQYLTTGVKPGSRVVLLFPPGLEYIQAFLGCLYAGVVAVPLYPPQSKKHAGRVLTVIDDCEADLVLTNNALKQPLEMELAPLPVVNFDKLIESAHINFQNPPTADQIAFLQYTSGSTGSPKGVMVSHGNIIANLKTLQEATHCSQEDVFCNWLPLFHDLGLVNTLLLPIYLGAHSILMSPVRFIKSPLAWLKAITEYKASICGAPNFGFDHCIERIRPHQLAGIDLSSWRVAFNAAEPVDADTLLKFSNRFSRVGFKESALYPAYGMAEATVFISGGSHSTGYIAHPFSTEALQKGQATIPEGSEKQQILVASGRVQTDHYLKIVSPERMTELPDGEIGEIWFSGPSLAQGYWNDAEKTKACFGARLKNDQNGYLRTGDLGFIHQGELYISGRIKDVLIIKGRNYYPQDFEKLAYNAYTGLNQNGAAAFEVNGKVVLLLEVSRNMQKEFDYKLACETIQTVIFEQFDLLLEDIVFLRTGRLNRTSSGKIQRSLAKARYLSNDLDCLYSFIKGQSSEDGPQQTDQVVIPVSELEAELCALWQEVFGLESIGVEDNFLNLGGHSLLASSLISQIQKKWNVGISIRSFFTANTVRKLAKVIESSSTSELPEIRPVSIGGPLLPSFAQERLWLVHQIESDHAQYNLSFSLKLYGELNEIFLLKSFKTILMRHQTLRTTYREEDGQVVQRVQESFQFDIPIVNLIELTKTDQEQRVVELTQEEAIKLFDLSQDLMLRVKLLKLNPQSHTMLITLHHIAADGWSLGVLTKELNSLYSAYVHGFENPLAPLNIQYIDYVYWQRDWLKEGVLQNHLNYWKDHLSNLPVIHSLPLDHPRPPVQTYRGETVYYTLSKELQEGLHNLARKNDATLFMLLNAAFASFLGRYSGEGDIVIGSPIANREQAELAPLIGFFINTLVFRSDLSADPSFLGLLQQSKERTFAAYENQQTPFEKLVDELQPERNLGHSPLFQIMLILQNQEMESLNLPGLDVKRLQPKNTVSQYDLTLTLHESENGLDMEWEYATDLFYRSTIERMIGNFEVLLQGIIKSPETQISQLPLLNNEESTQLLKNWNDRSADFPKNRCFHELFEEQVERNPDAVATVFNNEELSYAELNQRGNQLARYLVNQGVKPDSLVGICVERSLDMLVGVLAIMKSGGAYLPLDPDYPKARLEYMIKDSGVQWVITQKNLTEQCSVEQVICLDDESLCDELIQLNQSNLNKDSLGLTSNHLAYLIYTSGSTGKPKGVMLEHHNLTNFLTSMQVEPGMKKEDTLLAVTSLSFDIHALELYLPVMVGGRVVIASSENVLSPDDLESLIEDHQVTSMQATPATWKMLLNNNWESQRKLKVLCGGEALRRDLKDELLKREVIELWNMYGPTETAVWSATQRIKDVVSLGAPIANTQFYVLDPYLNPVPIGVAGELYIGGEGVARGYLNQPDLTAEKFIKNTVVEQSSNDSIEHLKNRIYKTGDLVRWLPDGTLEYLRRIDLQVKVRGHRIELEEIETRLKQHPEVEEAVAHVWVEGETSNLVAYVTANTPEIEKGIHRKLTDYLETFLPGYMIPSAYLCLEKIPLTPNGKINRSALPRPECNDEADYIPPQTETEKKLCQMWQLLLNLEVEEEQWISITSNFFRLGGHSLLAARLVSKIRKQWNVEVPVRTLFTEQTVRKLAKVIDHSSISQIPEIVPVSTGGPISLSFAQQRLWLIEQIERGSNQYNLCQAFQFSGKLDVAAMTSAFQSIVERHHVLRTTIRTTEAGEAIQVVCSNWDFSIPLLDLTDKTEEEQERAVLRYIEEESSQSFDLSTDLMIRVKLLKCHSDSHVLLVTMHHIAIDGWSVGIIFNEFNRLYRSPHLALPDLAIQYADYAYWQNSWLQGEALDHHLQFWKERLQDLPEVHNLALDRPRSPIQLYEGSHYHQILGSDVQNGLNRLARSYDTTLFMVLQTAFAILLARHSNKGGGGSDSENIVIGTPVANREQAELSPLVGFFVNSLVLRTNLCGNPRFDGLLQRSKEYLLDAYDHTQLPFEKLVDEFKQERNLGYSPLFQVKLALQNNEQGEFDLPNLSCKRIEQSHSVALHDLSLDIFEVKKDGSSEGLKLDWEYATALFDASTIERMAKHFEVLLKGIIEKPQARISELPFLTTAEVEQLLSWSKWSSTADDSTVLSMSARKHVCVLDLFEEQVENHPDHVAVMFNESAHSNERLTYKELNAKANQVARYLIEQGVKPDTLVGLCVERSLEMIIGIWGILKAGGAYVPIDPDYPEKHIEHILEDSGVEIVLTSSELLSELPFDELQILPLDEEMWEGFLGDYSLENVHREKLGVSINNLAYVIYTSGSTGLPKGVAMEHSSLAQSTLSRFDVYQESPGGFALFSSFAFDSSIVGIFWTLISGGKLCIVDIKQGVDLNTFQTMMAEESVSHFLTLPSVYQSMLSSDLQPASSLKTIIVAGEACDQSLVKHHQSHHQWRNYRLINEYGPTEACVWSSYYDCTHHSGGVVPIGSIVPHAELFVLDSQLQLCPLGVRGELYVGGESLARGYLNAPELTHKKFIPSPFHDSQRLYKTGDLVRCLPDQDGLPGKLEFLGRLDHQIKIRGFRIELGEIEAAIGEYEHVSEAVVLAKTIDPSQNSKQLVAYVVPDKNSGGTEYNETVFREALQTYLIKYLLNHKIPSVFVILDQLPHTPNGKIDREALLAKEVPSQLRRQYVPPKTDIEKQLCEIWQSLLKVKKIGITENFFAIGGDSILAIQAVAQAAKDGLVFTTRQTFECQTIEKLAPQVNSEAKISAPQNSISGEQILIPIQREFASTDLIDQHHYNQSVLLAPPKDFSLDTLQKTVLALYQRHDVLRLSVSSDKAKYIPLTDQLAERAIQYQDLGQLEGEAWESALVKLGAEAKAGLSLIKGDVFRALLFEGKADQRRLLLTLHHMVVDGVSWRILLQDLAMAFEQWQQQETILLPPKTSSFQQWGQCLLDYSNSDAFQSEKAYWLAQAREQVNALPVDHGSINDNRINVSKTLSFQLSATKTQALLNHCTSAYRTHSNDLLLSALYLALHQWTGQTAFRIDLESHGRDPLRQTLDLTQTVGWFTSVFPVTLVLDSAASISEVIKTVKEHLRRIPHNGIGFGLLQQMIRDDANRADFGQTMGRASEMLFNYLGQFDQVVNKNSPFQEAFESVGEDVSLQRQRSHMLELNGMVTGGQLGFSLRYNGLQYAQDTMESLAQGIESALYQIIDHCQSREAGGVTPSDFPLSHASQTQLDEWYQTYPNVEKVYPTTGMQQGLLFHSGLDVSAYLTQLSVDMEGSLDSIAMKQAWNEVVRRHDVFRTVFSEDHTHQLVLSEVTLPFTELDWSEYKESEQQQRLAQFLKEDRAQGFDLKQVPLMRITLIALSQQRNCLIWSNHHALSDGWSLPLVLKEVMALYGESSRGSTGQPSASPLSSLLPKAQPYESYIAWLQQQDDEKARSYWRDMLASIETPTQINVDRIADGQPQGARKQSLTLTQEKSAQLQSLAKHHQVTLNTLIQAAWAYLLHRYSGEEQVVFGETISGRPAEIKGVEHMVGLFINSLPVLVNIDLEQEIGTWLRTLHQASIDRVDYGFLPLSEIQNLNRVSDKGGRERNLFESLLVFENYPVDQEIEKIIEASELSVTGIKNEEQTNYALTLMVLPESTDLRGKLSFELGYRAERYEEGTITRILQHLESILTGLLDQTRKTTGELSILTTEEEHQLLIDWNDTASDYPKDRCIHELFEEQVERNPDAVAVVFSRTGYPDEPLTYGELNAKSNRLAHYLVEQGVKPDTLVGLCVERSVEMLIGLLGILKAGGAYVPLDPSYPASRLSYMLEDSGVDVLLTQQSLVENLSLKQMVEQMESEGAECGRSPHYPHIVSLDQFETFADYSRKNIDKASLELGSHHLAYVIYTSGSTGKPKGVAIEHHSSVALVYWAESVYSPKELSGVLASTSINFDLSVYEIFLTLSNGGKIILAPNVLGLTNLANKESITLINTVPSAMEELIRLKVLPDSVQTINLAGEPLLPTLVDKIYANSSVQKVYDLYGPSEDTTYSTFILRGKNAPQTIGRPIANTQIYILDQHNSPQPIGVPGELYIAGDGLARGYLNRPELTEEKFIPNPFNPGTRMYKSGDLARWLGDGNIEYLGRIDTQVKIRGFRIELGEIESRLNQYPEIKDSVVVAQGQADHKQLIAFYLTRDTEVNNSIKPLNEDLKAHLQKTLPEYMLPTAFVSLETMPLTPNGKVDRRALEHKDVSLASNQAYLAPRNATEKQLVAIWAEVLNLEPEKIGVNDNFFELGGHSLLVTKVTSKIRAQLAIDLPTKALFEKDNIASLTLLIAKTERSKIPAILPINRTELGSQGGHRLPLSFVQERLWFIDQLEPDNPSYNIPGAVTISGELDIDHLERAFNQSIARHENLRTIFPSQEGRAQQWILNRLDFKLACIDLSHHESNETRHKEAKQLCQTEAATPFDLAKGPLIRGQVIKLAAQEHILMLTMHHIITDELSVRILIKELRLIMDCLRQGQSPDLPPLPIQYLDYSVWQRKLLEQSGLLEQQLAYWQEKLAGVPECLNLATDYPRPSIQDSSGATSEIFRLDTQLTSQLKSLAEQQGCTLYMTLLAAFKVLLHRYTGEEDICLGTPIANRQYEETESLIGMFVNTLALRSQLEGEASFVALLTQVKATCLEAYEHRDAPFEKVVDLVQPERNMSISALFQIMFILHNETMEAPEQGFQPYPLEYNFSRFDQIIHFTETPEGLEGFIGYRTALYKPETIERMAKHFIALCRAITTTPTAKISGLKFIGEAEKQQLLIDYNNTQAEYPKDKCIHQLFIEQVAINPNKQAAVQVGSPGFEGEAESKQMSYQQLYDKSYDLALYLQSLGVKPDSLVGLCAGRSLEMMVGILGILQAGGAYVPLDPDYPDDRLTYMLEDSQATIVLTLNTFKDKLKALVKKNIKLIALDQQGDFLPDCTSSSKSKERKLRKEVKPDNLAYVIYTSGSTGQPKGVMIEHRMVIDYSYSVYKKMDFHHCETFAAVSTFSADLGNIALYVPIMFSKTIYLFSSHYVNHPVKLNDYMDNHPIDCMKITPSHFEMFKISDTQIVSVSKVLIFAGEPLTKNIVDTVNTLNPGCKVFNNYGPTETTISKLSTSELISSDISRIYLGKPLNNTQIYILDRYNQPQPIGVPGELHIAGDGVARGYLNRPELTEEKFIPNPFNPGTRMYKSGDLARWLGDGNIEYLGRIDNQVKIRGFRIELGEIEARLNQRLDIENSVVVIQGQAANKQLIAFYVTANTAEGRPNITNEDLREHLLQTLPDYMLPAVFVSLEAIPLTPNGKVDRRALERMDVSLESSQTYLAPRNETEKQLVDLWAEVLELEPEKIGINDNFFELGGHSLLAIMLVSKAVEHEIYFEIRDMFNHPSIQDLMENCEIEDAREIIREEGILEDAVALSPIQLYFFERIQTDIHHFNQSVLLNLNANLSIEDLQELITLLVEQHDALRFRYTKGDNGWRQHYLGSAAIASEMLGLHSYDIASLDEKQVSDYIEETCNHWQARLDIEKGPIMRWLYFDSKGNRFDQLAIIIHHLMIDTVSWHILLEDLNHLIGQQLTNQQLALSQKRSSYRDWVNSLVAYQDSNQGQKDLAFWFEKSKKTQQVTNAFSAKSYRNQDILPIRVLLSKPNTEKLLKHCHQAYGTDINDLLLTAVLLSYYQVTGNKELIIEMEGHGRDQINPAIDITKTVGWFTSIFPVSFGLSNPEDIGQSIKEIKGSLHDIPNKGIGFSIFRYINQHEEIKEIEAPQVKFNYLGEVQSSTGESTSDYIAYSQHSSGSTHSPQTEVDRHVTIDGLTESGQLSFTFNYPEEWQGQKISHWQTHFISALEALIEHCHDSPRKGYTPSDFPLLTASLPQLEKITLNLKNQQNIELSNIQDIYPLTPSQAGILFETLYAQTGENKGMYLQQYAYGLSGQADIKALQQAWQLIVNHYDALRTLIITADVANIDTNFQVVLKQVDLQINRVDCPEKTYTELKSVCEKWMQKNKRAGISLDRAPLMRVSLFQGQESCYMLFEQHHIVTDGWAKNIVLSNLFKLYQALVRQQNYQLPPTAPYGAYVQALLNRNQKEETLYWKKYLVHHEVRTPLPMNHLSPQQNIARAVFDTSTFFLSQENTIKLEQLIKKHRLTMNTVLQFIWGLLLHLHSGNRTITFGSVSSGRTGILDTKHGDQMVGLCINTIPTCIRFDADLSLVDQLKQMQSRESEKLNYEITPLIRIQELLGINTNEDFFQILFVYESYPVDEESTTSSMFIDYIDDTAPNYPLSIVGEPGEKLSITFEYDSYYYNKETVTALTEQFKRLIRQLITAPESTIKEVTLISAQERQQLLIDYNNTQADCPQDKCIHQLFIEQVAESPDKIAVVYQDAALSYQQLYEKSHDLALYLQSLGVQPDSLVGLCVERSLEMMVGILGILQAGGAYVPLDSDYPDDRLAYMLQDSQTAIVLTQEKLEDKLSALVEQDAQLITLDKQWSEISDCAAELKTKKVKLQQEVQSHHLAYMIYTSGSTGKPKGVMVEHRSLVNHNNYAGKKYQITNNDRQLLFSSMNFDLFVEEVFVILNNGAQLVIEKKDNLLTPQYYKKLIKVHNITVLNIPTAFFHQLVVSDIPLDSVKNVIVGGEQLEYSKAQAFTDKFSNINLYNTYGPTETTIISTVMCVTKDRTSQRNAAPIGRPINNTQIYILDQHNNPVPKGVPGELYIAGDGLARGYLNRLELTQEKFIANPFNPGTRMYKSGDLARWLGDGNIEYIGRIDTQVKIRGFRIELGEIEAQLNQYPEIKDSAVITQGQEGNKKLVAYYVARDAKENHIIDLVNEDLRAYLLQTLPDYMLPVTFVSLEAIPLTPNGKVDRRALKRMDVSLESSQAYLAPRNDMEKLLVAVWAEVLGIEPEKIGVNDNFFELGGHSLLATQLFSKIRNQLTIDLPMAALFNLPVIAGMAEFIKATQYQIEHPIHEDDTEQIEFEEGTV